MNRFSLLTALLSFGAGCAAEQAPVRLSVVESPKFAVVESDYISSAISILNEEGETIADRWVHSGTVLSGLSSPLSGDVFLLGAEPGHLAWIDRGNDSLSRASFLSGDVDQWSVGGAFRANPQDGIAWDDGYWVSRHEPNLDPARVELDGGNDLAFLDSNRGEVVRRIDLSPADTSVSGEKIYARPARLARFGDYLVVGLARLSVDFMVTGPGAVALVNPTTSEVLVSTLSGLSNCGFVHALGPSRVLVGCTGPAFTEGELRRAGAGVVVLGIEDEMLVQQQRFHSMDFALDVTTDGPMTVSGQDLYFVSSGSVDLGRADRLGKLNLDTGEVVMVHEAGGAFVLGEGIGLLDTAWIPSTAPSGVLRLTGPDSVLNTELTRAGGRGSFAPRQLTLVEP